MRRPRSSSRRAVGARVHTRRDVPCPGLMAIRDLTIDGQTIPANTHGTRLHRAGQPVHHMEIEWEIGLESVYTVDPGPDFDGIVRY